MNFAGQRPDSTRCAVLLWARARERAATAVLAPLRLSGLRCALLRSANAFSRTRLSVWRVQVMRRQLLLIQLSGISIIRTHCPQASHWNHMSRMRSSRTASIQITLGWYGPSLSLRKTQSTSSSRDTIPVSSQRDKVEFGDAQHQPKP